MHVLIIPGLTLQHVSDADVERIRHAAGADTRVSVVPDLAAAVAVAADVEVILGFLPRRLFDAEYGPALGVVELDLVQIGGDDLALRHQHNHDNGEDETNCFRFTHQASTFG